MDAIRKELEENRGVYGKDCAFTGSCSKDCAENVKLSIRIEELEARLKELEWISAEDELPGVSTTRRYIQLYKEIVRKKSTELVCVTLFIPAEMNLDQYIQLTNTMKWRKITLPEKE